MKNIQGNIAFSSLAAFFTLVLILCFHSVPTANSQMINIFVGLLGSFAGTAVGYYLGSSKGSQDKTAIINNSLNTPNGDGATTDPATAVNPTPIQPAPTVVTK